jgi:hypothetical protein
VLLDFDQSERRATSGVYLLPVVFALLSIIPVLVLVAMLLAKDAPLPLCAIPLLMGAVFGGITVYSYRKLQRYRLARATLQTWAQSRGFVAQGRAFVGIDAARRCAAFPTYRRVARSEYVFEGFALLIRLSGDSNVGLHLQCNLKTQTEAMQLLHAGFGALMARYCQTT